MMGFITNGPVYIMIKSLTPHDAAGRLHSIFDEPTGYWLKYLANNRRVDRNPKYRIQFNKVGGSVRYTMDAIMDFVGWENFRRANKDGYPLSPKEQITALQGGKGLCNVGGFGFNMVSVLPLYGQGQEAIYTQIILSDPPMIYKLSPKDVRKLVAGLSSVHRLLCDQFAPSLKAKKLTTRTMGAFND